MLVHLLAGLLAASVVEAPARDRDQYQNVDPALRRWVQGLRDKPGQRCCDTADGFPAEYEWDTAGRRYRVQIEGQWFDVPDEALGLNKLGYATVWYWVSWEIDGTMTAHIRCFLPGTGGRWACNATRRLPSPTDGSRGRHVSSHENVAAAMPISRIAPREHAIGEYARYPDNAFVIRQNGTPVAVPSPLTRSVILQPMRW